ncbi:hypothetical protein NGRA_3434, partial [Nosema granulosis]
NLQGRVTNAIRAYNSTIHSAIGLTPNEAIDKDNLSRVKQIHFSNRIEKYRKLFSNKTQEKYNLNDFVLIEDPIHKIKGQPKFGKIGEIVCILNNDTYLIAHKKTFFKRHVTQLRKVEENDFFL